MKNHKAKFIAIVTIIVLVGCCVGCAVTKNVTENPIVETETTNYLSDECLTGVMDNIESNIYGRLDEYLAEYVTNEDLSKYVTEDVINDITAQIMENLESYELTENQKNEVSVMIDDAVNSINYNNLTVKATTGLSESSKAWITNETTNLIQQTLKNTSITTDCCGEDIIRLEHDLNAKIDDLSNQLSKAIKEGKAYISQKEINYSLTEEDITEIENTIINNLGITAEIEDKGMATYLQDLTTEIVVKEVETVVNAGYTPVKGVDYFTDAEVESIVNTVTEKVIGSIRIEDNDVSGGNIYMPIKGVDYFTNEEVAEFTQDVVTIVESNFNDSITDIQNQINAINSTINGINTSISSLEDTIVTHGEQIAMLLESEDGISLEGLEELTAKVNAAESQIVTLQTKAAELESDKLNISTYTTYVSANDLKIADLTEADKVLQENISALEISVNDSLLKMQEIIDNCASAEDVEKLQKAFDVFKEIIVGADGTGGEIGALKTTCDTLTNTKLNKADFEAFQLSEAVALAKLSESLEKQISLIGTTEFSTGDYDTLSDAIAFIQKQINDFYSEYGNAIADVNNDVATINVSIGTRADGSVYTDYSGSLWKAVAELNTALADFEEEQGLVNDEVGNTLTGLNSKTTALNSTVTALKSELTSFKTTTNAALLAIDNDISDIQTELSKKLDTTTFTTYQAVVNSTLDSLEEAVAALEKSISDEKTARINADTNLTTEITELNTAWASFKGTSTLTLAGIESSLAYLNSVDTNQQALINGLYGTVDVNNKISAGSGVTVVIDSVYQYGRKCFGNISFTYNGNSLNNKSLFSIDSSIAPIVATRGIGINHTSGNTYLLVIDTAGSIRTASMVANGSYNAGETVSAIVEWYVK